MESRFRPTACPALASRLRLGRGRLSPVLRLGLPAPPVATKIVRLNAERKSTARRKRNRSAAGASPAPRARLVRQVWEVQAIEEVAEDRQAGFIDLLLGHLFFVLFGNHARAVEHLGRHA